MTPWLGEDAAVDRVFVFDYQLQVELVGTVRLGDLVSWEVKREAMSAFWGSGRSPSEAWAFVGDEALAVEEDEPGDKVISGQVTSIDATWGGSQPDGEVAPDTIRTLQRYEADRWQRKESPGPNLTFLGYLIAVDDKSPTDS